MALIIQNITSTGTWTVPTGVYLLNEILLVGGGGGGGSNLGGGGGGGRISLRTDYAVTPGTGISVTIGNGGGSGGTGGTTIFGPYSVAGGNGGANNLGSGGDSSGGTGGASGARTGGGGASAAGSGRAGGDYPGSGADGYYYKTNGLFYSGGGQGGSQSTTQYGRAITRINSQGGGGGSGLGGVGQAGTANRGGGGGGGGSSQNGGAGGTGIVVVSYYEPEYELTSDTTGIGEGETITFTLRTSNVANGSTVPFTITGTGVSSADFAPASLTGSFTITSTDGGANGLGSASLTLVNDSTTEGNEIATLTLNGIGTSITFAIGDRSISGISLAVDTIGNFHVGYPYEIVTVGTTDFTLIGASSNTVGVSFTATGSGTVTAPDIVATKSYTIRSVGTTDFTLIGASSNTVGVTFTASGAGSGTGTAIQGNGTAKGPWISKTIQIADYNDIQSKVGSVLGTGSVDYGYGQTLRSSQVSISSRVTVNDWSNLRYDIINAWQHIYGSIPSLVQTTASDIVKANALTSPYKQYDSYANVIVARRFSPPPVSESVTTAVSPSQSFTGTWSTSLNSTINIDFTTSEQARFFFNSGGEIRLGSTRSGGSSTTQNNTWGDLLTQSQPVFGGNKPGVGTTPDDGTNYHRLTTTYQVWFTSTASSPYATNTFKVSARINPSDSTMIQFYVEWLDQHAGLGGSLDQVDGTITLGASIFKASGLLQPSGIFTIESPTVTIGAITGS